MWASELSYSSHFNVELYALEGALYWPFTDLILMVYFQQEIRLFLIKEISSLSLTGFTKQAFLSLFLPTLPAPAVAPPWNTLFPRNWPAMIIGTICDVEC